NLSKRGEITKQRIKNCVTKGTYEFTNSESAEQRCTAKLSYVASTPDKTLNTYSFADLQDLRGRALLIAKSPVTSKISEDGDNGVDEITSDDMNEFVIQVDLAQQIINVASILIERHFTYRKFNVTTSSTKDMEDLHKMLAADLEEWERIVDTAQQDHYYLTFYPAHYVLNFYDYFFFKENDSNRLDVIK
ncbi:2889_t:CDS:2, partial [Acaulospora colombiana]